MQLSRWWTLDPDIIELWATPDWLNRQEYMYVQMDLSKPPDENGLNPGETIATRPIRD